VLKKSRIFLIVICLILSGCTVPIVIPVLPTETEVIPTVPTATEEFSLDATQWLSTVFAYSTTTPTPVPLPERPPITSDLVKNIEPAIALSLNESEEIKGLPVDVSPAWAVKLKAYYQAVKSLYPTSEVLLDVDSTSNSHIIIIVMGDTIYYQIIKNPNGDNTYPIFPTSFETGEAGLILSGDYKPVKVPNTSIGVVWFEGIPQLLANYVELPDGNSCFTHYMDYSGVWSYDAYPWQEVEGVSEIMAAFPAVELDLEPVFVQSTECKFAGVLIKSSLVVDDSNLPLLKKLTIPDHILAEYVARVFFNVWWSNGPEKHFGTAGERDFYIFMELWAQAQKSGETSDWEKVQINNIWANDLRDGFGYKYLSYNVWPMYFGEAPEGIQPIDEFSFAFVGGDRDKYISRWATIFSGKGTNKDDKELYIYQYYEDFSGRTGYNITSLIADYMAFNVNWLKHYKGGEEMSKSVTISSQKLRNLLINGGISIY